MAKPTFNPDTTIMMDAKTGSIPFEEAEGVITGVKNGSAYMQLAKAESMTKPIKKFTHLSGVGAYWVDEAERIQTSKPTWLQVEMRAYKLGVIIPATKEHLQFSVSDFFEQMKPEIAEAFARKFDAAAFSGKDTPFSNSIIKAAKAEGNIIAETVNKYDDIDKAMAKLEAQDLTSNGIASLNKQRTKYRGSKDGNGLPIFNPATAGESNTVVGLPVAFLPNSTFADDEALEIVGDWNNAYYGIINNVEYEILTEATLTTVKDEAGENISLAERDMVALKATMMVGMMVVKDEAFSIIKDAAGGA